MLKTDTKKRKKVSTMFRFIVEKWAAFFAMFEQNALCIPF